MKRQSIVFILLLLLTLTTLCGCSSAKNAPMEAAEAVPMEAAFEEIIEETAVFEGLEDNHTALFSFDGVEIVFVFETPEVQAILSEEVVGSTYTISYKYDSSRGLNVLFEISE